MCTIAVHDAADEKYAFVNYFSHQDAHTAVYKMNGCILQGKRVSVKLQTAYSIPQPQFTVKVQNLSKETMENTLEREFSLHGTLHIHSLKVVRCEEAPVNFAYINYQHKSDVEMVIKLLNNKVVDGKMIKVKEHGHSSVPTWELPSMKEHGHSSIPIWELPSVHESSASRHALAHQRKKSSSTVKVSLHGLNVTAEDVKGYFSQFGKFTDDPIIQPGNPNFAYINFENPREASAACSDTAVCLKGTTVTVKPAAGKAMTEIWDECVACDDALVAKLALLTIQTFVNEKYNVTVNFSQSQFKLWGTLSSIKQAKLFIEMTIQMTKDDIGEESFSLPYYHAPSFANPAIFTTLQGLEQQQFFSLEIVSSGVTLPIDEFSKLVTQRFRSDSDIPQIGCLSSYLSPQNPGQVVEYQWLWEDDSGSYMPYQQDICCILNREIKNSPTAPIPCKIGSHSYNIDLEKFTQTNEKTKKVRKIKQEPLTPVAELELNLKVRTLRSSLVSTKLKVMDTFSDAVARCKCPLPPTNDDSLKLSLLNITKSYFVRVKIVSLKEGGEAIKLKGVCGYVEKVEMQVREAILSHKSRVLAQTVATSHSATGKVDLPNTWEEQTQDIELKKVKPESDEWKRIVNRVHETLPTAQVEGIERIQALWLWEGYCFSKERMSKKNKGITNEKELFHGTRRTCPEKIFRSEQGFDFRFASRGMWGEGIYFAAKARYSDDYAYHHETQRQMILAKVLTGETYKCPPNSSLKKPPIKPRAYNSQSILGSTFKDELYDSVSGHTNGSDIFVIYDHGRMYPAYLITYTN